MNKKSWTVIFIVVAFAQWLNPTFAGVLFNDISASEGRIVATICFVAGIILYFIPTDNGGKK